MRALAVTATYSTNAERSQAVINPNDLYTHTICEGGGDIPGWMVYAICALPYVLVLLDFLGGR